ncbi:glyoxalase/bleomycin resistance protein/dioxygenase superfamily protein [Paenibacillus pabuli]|uniref:Glyoxalase/bleomycin resistance protein/dioxygenase superfamily protein n=1 Tax=Paenibacillus pabuli TaxID=1472 RepID=A0ABX9BSI9_9BACL|nr:VOC family protein [Paenibacillus pabuli]RAJ03129.1 glyoxalase/bleomycin resistance protein/dioxygenase superfamily protein [Paenibacillus pabuli]
MNHFLLMSHSVFPTLDIKQTVKFYEEKMGFRVVEYLDTNEPHVCLYRDDTEIILTLSNGQKVIPNRELYGYGYDAYFITKNQEELQQELINADVKIVRPLNHTDYNNKEFVIEDVDGRWIAFGIKQE